MFVGNKSCKLELTPVSDLENEREEPVMERSERERERTRDTENQKINQ